MAIDYREKSPSERSDSAELSHFDFDVQLAAVKIAQLSLAPSTEYIGGGTLLCALHKVRVWLLLCFHLLDRDG